MDSKNKGREDCKNEYILQLQQTNKDQRDYYSTKLPAVFQVSTVSAGLTFCQGRGQG